MLVKHSKILILTKLFVLLLVQAMLMTNIVWAGGWEVLCPDTREMLAPTLQINSTVIQDSLAAFNPEHPTNLKYLSTEDEVFKLSEYVKQRVRELGYQNREIDKISNNLLDLFLSQKDNGGSASLLKLKQQLAVLKESKDSFPAERFENQEMQIIIQVMDMITAVIKPTYDEFEGMFLEDVLKNKKAQGLGYTQLFCILAGAIGLEAFPASTMYNVENLDKKFNMLNYVRLITGKFVRVDLINTRLLIKGPFLLTEEYYIRDNYFIPLESSADKSLYSCIRIESFSKLPAYIWDVKGALAYRKFSKEKYKDEESVLRKLELAKIIKIFLRAKAIDHDDLLVHLHLANIYALTGIYQKSVEYISTAIQLTKHIFPRKFVADLYQFRGELYLEMKRNQEARKDFVQAIELNPLLEKEILECWKAETKKPFASALNKNSKPVVNIDDLVPAIELPGAKGRILSHKDNVLLLAKGKIPKVGSGKFRDNALKLKRASSFLREYYKKEDKFGAKAEMLKKISISGVDMKTNLLYYDPVYNLCVPAHIVRRAQLIEFSMKFLEQCDVKTDNGIRLLAKYIDQAIKFFVKYEQLKKEVRNNPTDSDAMYEALLPLTRLYENRKQGNIFSKKAMRKVLAGLIEKDNIIEQKLSKKVETAERKVKKMIMNLEKQMPNLLGYQIRDKILKITPLCENIGEDLDQAGKFDEARKYYLEVVRLLKLSELDLGAWPVMCQKRITYFLLEHGLFIELIELLGIFWDPDEFIRDISQLHETESGYLKNIEGKERAEYLLDQQGLWKNIIEGDHSILWNELYYQMSVRKSQASFAFALEIEYLQKKAEGLYEKLCRKLRELDAQHERGNAWRENELDLSNDILVEQGV
ncbi:MAG: tetratricopeptide repeat protein [PVC group bacterium]|nr:tetratricopeptide repeat protein [PVC group bacterium]